jgi:hypothetical protein
MKILIAGLAKTGTTGLLYLVKSSMGGEPRLLFEPQAYPAQLASHRGDIIAKVLIGPKLDAGSFAGFDRKITLVRDPRDRMISSLLYSQYHANYLGDEVRVAMVRAALEAKEANPSGMSLAAILEVIGKATGRPRTATSFRERAKRALAWFDSYLATIPDGLLYKYEDFVSGEYARLQRHLGMRISGAAQVPDRLSRVARTKAYGDWRNWFTEDDVREFRPLLSPWLEKHGYDADDWQLSAEPSVDPAHCSLYYSRLVEESRAKNSHRAKIMRAEPGLVAGWMIGADPAQPVQVALLVNGNEVARAVADRPRPNLKKQGMHPTGQCGFVFQFKDGDTLKVGDLVTVQPLDVKSAADNAVRGVVGAAAR